MNKILKLTMEDGSVWALPANTIAMNRAIYYMEKEESKEDKERVLKEEVEYALEDADELIDWARNNMNWSDVSQEANQLKEPDNVDFELFWGTAEMEVVNG